MSGYFKAITALLLAALTSPLTAVVQLDVRYHGEAVHDTRVCVYPVGSGEMFKASGDDFRCYDSGEVIEFPDEAFRVVATSGPLLIGISDVFTSDYDGTVLIDLSPGAKLELQSGLTADQRLVIIMGEGAVSGPGLLPLEVDGHVAVVPAETPLIPVIAEDGEPKQIGTRLELGEGETGNVTFGADENGTVVLLPLITDAFRSERGRTLLSKQSPPLVTIEATDGTVYRPALPVSEASGLFDTVLVFRGVAGGETNLRIAGERWQPAIVPMEIPVDSEVVLFEPVTVELGSELLVELDLPFAPFASVEPCGAAVRDPGAVATMALLDCQDVFTGEEIPRNLLKQCETMATRELIDQDRLQFPGIAPGQYVITTSLDDQLTNVRHTELRPGETTEMGMPFAETYVSGRVTLDGKPVAAEVRFPSGSGVTDPHTGEYFALLSRPYRAGPVYVVACDESLVYLHHPSDRVPNGPGYDLQIPTNEVAIHVRDKRTDEIVSDGSASLWVVEQEDPDKMIGGIPADPVDDHFRVANVEEGWTVVACAEKEGYLSSCTDPLLVRMKTESLTVNLSSLDRTGRVHATGYEMIYWVRPDGTISERASINDAGEFHYGDDHPMDHVVLTGSAPLWVTRIDDQPSEVLELTPPTSPVRQVRFELGAANPKKNSIVLLWVNGLPVPIDAFNSHQRVRGQHWLIVNRVPIVVADLFASDRIAVAEGPDPDVAPPGILDPGVSLFVGRTPTAVRTQVFVFGSEANAMTPGVLSR